MTDSQQRYVGIDPGMGGGLACLSADRRVLMCTKMPETERDLLDVLGLYRGSMAVLERVHSSPQMGVKSAFTFGQGYGGLRMALTACGISFQDVTPKTWQKFMSCMTGGDKNVSKRMAQSLFPDVKVTHAVADALLLAEYLRRQETF